MVEQMVSLPDVAEVASFLGVSGDNQVMVLAEPHLRHVTAMARSRTRGQGFDAPNHKVAEDLAAVIVAATARQLGNPEQDRRVAYGDYSVVPQTGWSLVEQAVLNRYRRMAL